MSLDRDAWAVVGSGDTVAPSTFAKLREAVGDPIAVLELAAAPAGRDRLAAILGPGGESAIAAILAAASEAADRVAHLRRSDVAVVVVDDPDYPPRLRAIEDPPPVLFVRGSVGALSPERAVAVVGTRRPTEGGRRLATRIASGIAGSDAAVVSGLAVGIDGAAHVGALDADGTTIAVLGGGHVRVYPRAHARLADDIVAHGGAVVSELGPWVHPVAWSFPRRNRIISGLADATVVVEAGARSGALITAGSALAQGRGCFVAPGPIDEPTTAGCLAFLREYHGAARIVAGVPELLVDLGLIGTSTRASRGGDRGRAALAEVRPTEREIATLIADGVGTIDELVTATELPVASVLAAITMLESRGLVVDALGRYRPAAALAQARIKRPRRGERDRGMAAC